MSNQLLRQLRVHHQKYPTKLVAVGEVGLDYALASTEPARARQRKTLQHFLGELKKCQILSGLPLILHVRDSDRAFKENHNGQSPSAHRDMVKILSDVNCTRKIYLHCFEGKLSLDRLIWLSDKWLFWFWSELLNRATPII